MKHWIILLLLFVAVTAFAEEPTSKSSTLTITYFDLAGIKTETVTDEFSFITSSAWKCWIHKPSRSWKNDIAVVDRILECASPRMDRFVLGVSCPVNQIRVLDFMLMSVNLDGGKHSPVTLMCG